MARYDVIIVGGGHNGLVASRYLAAAGLRVLVLEKRSAFGGPAAKVEWMPGYFCSVTNSPGSLEPKIVREMELESFGLRFVKPDPTLVHPLEDGRLFVGWRDRARGDAQLESYAPGEAERYRRMFEYLEAFARRLGVSVFDAPPTLAQLTRNLTTREDEEAFARVFFGSARALFDDFLDSEEAKAIVGPMAVVSGQVSPSTPGTPINLMMRPLSIASVAFDEGYDPRRMPLRGSTGLPIGGMGAIIDAMVASARAAGVTLRRETGVSAIRIRGERVKGVVTEDGEEIDAPVVVSAINPRTTLLDLIGDHPDWADMQARIGRRSMRGKAYKLILALDAMPRYAAAADDAEAALLASAQYRTAPTLDYLEESHADMMLGRAPQNPVIWGLCPSMTSPGLAPEGKHIMSMNIGNAPYCLQQGDWAEERDRLARRCIETAARWMPNLPDIVSDYRCIDPVEFESDYGLVEANITHGDTLPWNQFWMRPLPGLSGYRTPTAGLYLSGAGTWPGNFVSGLPGHNTAHRILGDLAAGRLGTHTRHTVSMPQERSEVWNS
ncbi:NAD(P)/FAD-dependent oxidoreductase [Aquibium sp. A9E412]|uniref:phytoene desaturase family protein n=1 Tax=Aquibium sp. A9E412 TaxID=2976767 RepID=UPI0025B217E1|nr:NAD(P)/FAD-dependent oxidoreductase [Aquibium sp. A9E412]MDN2566397.1 NAD(P)/FAD-dependent oxidoreductase [Aquibium sp. A9E412]